MVYTNITMVNNGKLSLPFSIPLHTQDLIILVVMHSL